MAVEVTDRGRRVGVLVHDAALVGDPAAARRRHGRGSATAGQRPARGRAAGAARGAAPSRARIVRAGDDERRRLGRDLHDGAQQRLVSVLIELQLRAGALRRDARPGARARRPGARRCARRGRRAARPGVGHPPGRALPARARRGAGHAGRPLAACPPSCAWRLDDRLPLPIETAAYFVVAEALTNVAKHAGATPRPDRRTPRRRPRRRRGRRRRPAAARILPAGAGCAGSGIGSERSTARSRSAARPGMGRSCACGLPCVS